MALGWRISRSRQSPAGWEGPKTQTLKLGPNLVHGTSQGQNWSALPALDYFKVVAAALWLHVPSHGIECQLSSSCPVQKCTDIQPITVSQIAAFKKADCGGIK